MGLTQAVDAEVEAAPPAPADGVLLSGIMELAPSPIAARAAKLRFSVAISLICSELMKELTTLESAWTVSALAETVTVSLTLPTDKLTSARKVWETFTSSPLAT